MGFEKAAYRGGCRSLPEPSEERYDYDRRYHDQPLAPARFAHCPADGDGARRMRMAALKAQADSFGAQFSEDLLADGRQRLVRHGAGPERVIQTRGDCRGWCSWVVEGG